jgi:hypothetical protein
LYLRILLLYLQFCYSRVTFVINTLIINEWVKDRIVITKNGMGLSYNSTFSISQICINYSSYSNVKVIKFYNFLYHRNCSRPEYSWNTVRWGCYAIIIIVIIIIIFFFFFRLWFPGFQQLHYSNIYDTSQQYRHRKYYHIAKCICCVF